MSLLSACNLFNPFSTKTELRAQKSRKELKADYSKA